MYYKIFIIIIDYKIYKSDFKKKINVNKKGKVAEKTCIFIHIKVV